MRKTFAVLLVFLLSSCASGNLTTSESPKTTARAFLDKVLQDDLKGAYTMLTKRQQSDINFDVFSQLSKDPQSGKKLSEMGLAFSVDEEIVGGAKAKVYGTTTIGEDKIKFRMPLIQEDGIWKIDSPATQIEVPGKQNSFVDFRLVTRASKFFQHMLNGEVQQMWDMTSSNTRENTTLEIFKNNMIGTRTGKIPKEEGFNIIVQIAWSDDEGHGSAGCQVQDLASKGTQGTFEANFVLENGEWMADFDRLELNKNNQQSMQEEKP